jgi:hypothetical protein
VPGFKLVFRYRNKSGLLKQAVIYGCVNRGHLYSLAYNGHAALFRAGLVDLRVREELVHLEGGVVNVKGNGRHAAICVLTLTMERPSAK